MTIKAVGLCVVYSFRLSHNLRGSTVTAHKSHFRSTTGHSCICVDGGVGGHSLDRSTEVKIKICNRIMVARRYGSSAKAISLLSTAAMTANLTALQLVHYFAHVTLFHDIYTLDYLRQNSTFRYWGITICFPSHSTQANQTQPMVPKEMFVHTTRLRVSCATSTPSSQPA
jgi:hypothetical protein